MTQHQGSVEIKDGKVFINGKESSIPLAGPDHPVMQKIANTLAEIIRGVAYDMYRASGYKAAQK